MLNLINLNQLLGPELDYNQLMDVLKGYKCPRDKVTELIKHGLIIRVKKGLYVLGDIYQKPFSKFVLANQIYGPSYVSGLSALAYYGMIPERVEGVYSKTLGRNKKFESPVGSFFYKSTSKKKFASGLIREPLDDARNFLVASPEKALIEEMLDRKITDIPDFFTSMRIEDVNLIRFGKLEKLGKELGFTEVKELKKKIKELR